MTKMKNGWCRVIRHSCFVILLDIRHWRLVIPPSIAVSPAVARSMLAYHLLSHRPSLTGLFLRRTCGAATKKRQFFVSGPVSRRGGRDESRGRHRKRRNCRAEGSAVTNLGRFAGFDFGGFSKDFSRQTSSASQTSWRPTANGLQLVCCILHVLKLHTCIGSIHR